MAAEEKKLSHNQPSARRKDSCRPHCFPDIPSGDPAACQPRGSAIAEFQRLDFHAAEVDCTRNQPDADSQAAPDKAKPADLSKNTYQQGFCDGRQRGLAEGQKQGYQAGEQAGFQNASRRAQPLIQSLQESLSQLTQLRQRINQQIEHEVVELTLAIARKIICHEAAIGRDTILWVVAEALKYVVDDRRITIKMNPADLQFMQDAKHQFSGRLSTLQRVSFEADESISSGGCRIETESGDIDARLDRQLHVIEESLRSQLPDISIE